jgi:hypothetical protein
MSLEDIEAFRVLKERAATPQKELVPPETRIDRFMIKIRRIGALLLNGVREQPPAPEEHLTPPADFEKYWQRREARGRQEPKE